MVVVVVSVLVIVDSLLEVGILLLLVVIGFEVMVEVVVPLW